MLELSLPTERNGEIRGTGRSKSSLGSLFRNLIPSLQYHCSEQNYITGNLF
jgi:hypothetical protein